MSHDTSSTPRPDKGVRVSSIFEAFVRKILSLGPSAYRAKN